MNPSKRQLRKWREHGCPRRAIIIRPYRSPDGWTYRTTCIACGWRSTMTAVKRNAWLMAYQHGVAM